MAALELALELPRGSDRAVAAADVHTAVEEGRPVVAKFRTGPTATWAWPDPEELAAVLALVTGLDVPFKLTGGLHHAVRGTYEVAGTPEENHGVLDVLVATAAALAGASAPELAALLAVRDSTALAGLVTAWPDANAAAVRTRCIYPAAAAAAAATTAAAAATTAAASTAQSRSTTTRTARFSPPIDGVRRSSH